MLKLLKKHNVSMQLPGDKRLAETAANKERIYKSFRRRVLRKSNHKYLEDDKDPESLQLALVGSMFESFPRHIVKVGSFSPILADSDNLDSEEIGFEVQLKNHLLGDLLDITLRVWRKKYKASMEIYLVKTKKKNRNKKDILSCVFISIFWIWVLIWIKSFI